MNILILSKKIPYPPRDGEAIATLNMALGLKKSGNEIWLLTMNTTKHFTSPEKIPGELKSKINITIVDTDTKIRPIRLLLNLVFSKSPYNAVRFRSDEYLYRLKEILKSKTFDIIQLEGPYLEFCVPVVREFSNAPVSLRAHNIEHLIWERRAVAARNPFTKFYLNTLKNRIRLLETKLIKKIDALVTISDTDLEGFRKMGLNAPCLTSPAGIDLAAYTPSPPPATFSLFFIGSLDWGPNTEGLDWFFENVWPAIIDKVPDISLYVAGRNSDFYFREKKLPERVFDCGEVEDALQFMREHSVMIAPLFSGSGIRIKILEGMAMKKTIVTTTIGAEGIEVTHKKNILIADNSRDFINCIGDLPDKSDMISEIGSAARKFVSEKFDTLALSKELTLFYKQQLS